MVGTATSVEKSSLGLQGREAQAGVSIEGTYRSKQIEAEMRRVWKEMGVRMCVDQKLSSKKKVGYVEGPPTLNGTPHMGHIRGRIMKDLWYRFSTMRGERVDFRGGWDCQGLPVELEAEKELGLSGNKTANLKKIGEEAFVRACKDMLKRYHKIWTNTDMLLGLSIDDSKAYWTFHDRYIEREWQYLRSAWENRILDEGFRVTPFCPSCQTSLSTAEVALGGYENLEDPSVYFKMKVRGRDKTYLVAWTTMPFTVITDEIVGVRPDSDYCFVDVKPEGSLPETEVWIVGSDRLEPLMKELHIQSYQVKHKVKGLELEGLRYEHPLTDLIPKQNELDSKNQRVHSVVAEDFVDVTSGSGLVHMSPANGEDDFDVAQRRNIPVFNPIDDQANFSSDAGAFSGRPLRDTDREVGDALKERSALLRYGKIKHEYPVCWRSGHRLLWLARRGYFYFVDRLEDMAVDAANQCEYFYDQPKNRFVEIIKEKRPWCISRERFWGNPLPVWRCDTCSEKLGLFSRKEIVARAKSLPNGGDFELHRPWIDRILVACPSCGTDMHRESFVLDTWHNSGAAPYASLTDEEYDEYIPVPFLTEGLDQTRGWAYSLLVENVILRKKPNAPFRAFLFMGFVLDEDGEKMSKSKDNFVAAVDLLNKESVDLSRFYLIWKASPIDSLSFSLKEMATRPYQVLNTLYHMHFFYLQNSTFDRFHADSRNLTDRLLGAKKALKKQDRWLLSRLESIIDVCTASYSGSRYQESARAIEKFLIEDLSQTYVPIIRGELWREDEGSRMRRETIYTVLAHILLQCDKLIHPISPFISDYLARRTFRSDFLVAEGWPSHEAQFRDDRLEAEFALLAKVVSVTNAAKMKARVKRRWPLRKAYYLASEKVADLVSSNMDILLELTNLANVEFQCDPTKTPLQVSVKPNLEKLAPRVKKDMDDVLRMLSASNPAELYNEIREKGKARLKGTKEHIDLEPSDLQFSFAPKDKKYAVSENLGVVVALDTSRDDELMAQGLVRDLARNLQALRKERGYNPTKVLTSARVAGLDSQSISMLEPKNDELAFLVRVRSVELLADVHDMAGGNWSAAEIDGREIKLDIV